MFWVGAERGSNGGAAGDRVGEAEAWGVHVGPRGRVIRRECVCVWVGEGEGERGRRGDSPGARGAAVGRGVCRGRRGRPEGFVWLGWGEGRG